jgi:hypothetical protein
LSEHAFLALVRWLNLPAGGLPRPRPRAWTANDEVVAPDLLEHLYRGLADNSVGRLIDQLLRADLILIDDLGFTPLDTAGGQLLFRLVAAAYQRRNLGLASQFPLSSGASSFPRRPPSWHCSTACSTTTSVHHWRRLLPDAEGQSQRR